MAAKTSASTAFNSYFYQQQQQQQQHTQAKQQQQQMENAKFSYEQFSDFHPKMSKKIAQLTKVIYALNSKNDESEFVMATIQNKYEEEKEQIIAETNRRLDEFREKFAETNDQSKKIVSLESAIDQYQKQKEKALKDLEEFRLKTKQNEETLIETHKIELAELNRRLNELHEEAVKQSSLFESAYKKFEKEKSHVAEELRAKHREEMEKLEEKYASNKDSLRLEKVKLAEKYDAEISRLRSEIDEAANKAAKEKLEYEQNLSKLKSFHERELDACKHNSSSEYLKIIESLKASLEAMKKEKQADESEFSARYNKKLEEIVSKEEEIKTLNETLLKYKSRLENSNNDVSLVNQKISSLEAEKLSLEAKITQLESDNQVCLKKIDGQSAKLLEKSNLISQLEATNMQNTSAISDLERELKSARERVESLEKERQSLEAQNNRLSDANSEVKLLREKIELLVNDSRSKAAEHEREVKSIREANEKMIERFKTDFQIEKQSLISSYESKLSTEKALFEEQLLSLKRDLTKDHNSEISKVLGDRSQLMAQLESLSQEHQSKMKQNEAEIASLKSKLDKALGELNEISTSYSTLKEENSKTVIDLSQAKETVSKQNRQISELTIEIEQLRLLLESTSKESKLELKVELEKLNRDLEAKWKEIVRVECERIKEEIERAKETERLAELDSLAGSKDEELRNLKSIWQAKTSELLNEISILKKELSEKEVTSKALFESTKAKLELENLELREHLNRVNAEHKARLDKIQAEQSQEHRVLLENLRKENEAKISELKMQHLEDLKAQTIAQKAALSSLKTTLENNKVIEIELVNEDNRKKFETFKMETEQKYYNDLDNLKQENELEIMSIRAELDKSRDQYKQKERETEIRLEDVHNEMRMKQKQIEKLSNELKETKMLMSTLREESELKQRELKQVKSEAANEMRNREVVLQQKRDEEIARLNAESHKQKQMLLVEFKQAQDLLKQKIVETEEELRQLHDRFLNRESRQEDLELIQVLRNNLAERDELIRKIQEEKKYFQMELVNRENNFNKMFNAAPNIGMINPLNANTKVKNKSFGGSSTSNKQAQITKLEPIPGGSPIHDLTLNPNKPLPKKFLS